MTVKIIVLMTYKKLNIIDMTKIKQISCSGGKDSHSKHPSVYLKLNEKKNTVCPYCSKTFSIGKRNNKYYIEAHEIVAMPVKSS